MPKEIKTTRATYYKRNIFIPSMQFCAKPATQISRVFPQDDELRGISLLRLRPHRTPGYVSLRSLRDQLNASNVGDQVGVDEQDGKDKERSEQTGPRARRDANLRACNLGLHVHDHRLGRLVYAPCLIRRRQNCAYISTASSFTMLKPTLRPTILPTPTVKLHG